MNTNQQQSISEIFKIIAQMARSNPNNKVLGEEAEMAIKKKGFTGEDFQKTLFQYTKLSLIYVSAADGTISFI